MPMPKDLHDFKSDFSDAETELRFGALVKSLLARPPADKRRSIEQERLASTITDDERKALADMAEIHGAKLNTEPKE